MTKTTELPIKRPSLKKTKSSAAEALEASVETTAAGFPEPKGKLATLANLMRREGGASIVELQKATGWQAHSVRGALAGALKKTHGLTITSSKTDGVRRYTAADGSAQ